MIDPKILRTDIKKLHEMLLKRGYTLDITTFKNLESRRKFLQEETESLQNLRNIKSREIGQLKEQSKDPTSVVTEVSSLCDQLKQLEKELKICRKKIIDFSSKIPNLPYSTVPVGQNESCNSEIYRWGTPRIFDFKIKDHVDIGEGLGGIDFQLASKLTGSRFVVMKREVAMMHRALIQFMLDTHIHEHNYEEVYVPYVVNQDSLYGTGHLPKFSEDLFHIQGHFPYSLIPTAEVPVTNLVRDTIIDIEHLPLKFVAHTPCFRSEAGSYGSDTRGLIRQHQFEKVEMVQIVAPHSGLEALESLRRDAENILRKLNLPYRVLELCTGDIGFSAQKTYDLEVWVASQKMYREISSCSWCGEFQARRMQARFRTKANKKINYVHTLNGSGLAVGRTLIAIMENNQQEDGSVVIPMVLRKYMQGLEIVKA
jgi:seryl-tRNA synthetase